MTGSKLDPRTYFNEKYRGYYRSFSRGLRRFSKQRIGVIGILIFLVIVLMAVFAPYIAPHHYTWTAPETQGGDGEEETLESLANETLTHPHPPAFGDPFFAPLGTNSDGQDVLSRIIYGSRTALFIGLAAGLLSSFVGVPLGLISGYYGDTWIDEGIQRIVDVMYGLPFLPLVIVLVAVQGVSVMNVILAIVAKSWLNNTIVIRGETLSLKEQSYVKAAKVSGASDARIIFSHILPNVLPLAFVYLAQDAAFAILIQASLAFLGLSDFTAVSWGVMLQWIQVTGHVFDAPWWLLPPGIMIILLAGSFYFIGYSLEETLNPHRRND